ncbi:MAG: DUF5693 family protein [Bacillota bacterium]
MKQWYRRVLVAVIGVSLVVSGCLGYQRHLLEQKNRTVEIAVVYDEMRELAAGRGMATGELLALLKERGVTSVLLKEPVADDSRRLGELAVMKGRELSLYRGDDFGPLLPDHTYIISGDREVADRVARQLRAKGVMTYELPPAGEWYGLGTPADLLSPRPPLTGLGFPERVVREIDGAGLNMMVQLRSWPGVTQQGLKEVFEPLHDIPNLTALLFNDESVPGYPEYIEALGYEADKLGVPVAQIEFTPQKGLNHLGLLLDKHMVRLHTMSSGEMLKYTPDQALDRYLLAVTERNMRVLLVRPVNSPGSRDPVQDNLLFIERLASELESEGLTVGKASTFGPLESSRLLLFIAGLGVVAGLMLLLDRLGVRPRCWLAAGLALAALWLLLLVAGQPGPGRKLMALAAVLVFPVLAIMLNLRREGVSAPGAILLLFKTSLVSLAGALLMVGLLADTGFMLKLDQFAGVKLAHLLPLLALVGYAFFVFRPRGTTWAAHAREFLNSPVTVVLGAVAGVLAVIAALYLVRTGNEGVGLVSGLEMQMRSVLDTWLGVRPRTKEFLLGHPLLLLLFYTGCRDTRYMPLLFLGAIGQVSLINTFAHIHTPLLVSLARAFNGLWLGVLMGLALIAAVLTAKKLWEKYIVE